MVALKLILQSLAGVVAVGGAIGGTVALSSSKTTTKKERETEQTREEATHHPYSQEHDVRIFKMPTTKIIEINVNEADQTKNVFYLVSSFIGLSDTQPSTDLFGTENQEVKNYQCVNRTQSMPITEAEAEKEQEEIITKDSSCIFYSLQKTTSSLKTSEIQTWTQSKTSSLATKVIKKSEIKEKKFFLLQGNENLMKFEANDRQPIIYLTKKNTNDFFEQSNYYVMLQVHAKISANEVTGATDTVIAKATTDQQDTRTQLNVLTPSYECSFKSEATKTDCALSKLSTYTNPNSFNFASSEIKNKKEGESSQKNAYYFIQSDGIQLHEAKDLKDTTATYIETQTQNSTSTTLNIEAAVFAKFNNDETRLTELIILDQ